MTAGKQRTSSLCYYTLRAFRELVKMTTYRVSVSTGRWAMGGSGKEEIGARLQGEARENCPCRPGPPLGVFWFDVEKKSLFQKA